MDRKCNICKAPWHPSSGHYISETMVWCGPCTKTWVREVAGMQKRKWGGVKFYDHATVPPPAVEKMFVMMVDSFSPMEKPHWSQALSFRVTGVTPEEARCKIADQIPEGKRVFAWYVDEKFVEEKP